MFNSTSRVLNRHQNNRWQIESLERRQMLSAATDAALASPLDNNLACSSFRRARFCTRPART